jgi:site-specific recombinase XerD
LENFKDYLELREHVKAYRDDGDVDQPSFGSERMGYNGLRAVLTRRAQEAGVEEPALHDFRRAFALAMLQNG